MKNDGGRGEGCSCLTDAERHCTRSKVHTREAWTDPKELKTFSVFTQRSTHGTWWKSPWLSIQHRQSPFISE